MASAGVLDETDPAVLDRLYNVRARVADSAAHVARWPVESAAARAALPCKLDIPYGQTRAETLDIFPGRREGAPVLFFIHGGYWRAFDKADHSFVAPPFVREGVCVVMPNYALCPAVTVPDIARQVADALAWTWQNITLYGGDPGRITVAGHSAGGHLTAMMLTEGWRARHLPTTPARNALAVSGLFDLASIRRTPFLQESLRLTPAEVELASPARLPAPDVSDGRGRLAAVVGSDETEAFLEQNALIGAAWGRTAVPTNEMLPGLNHFSVLDEAFAKPGHRLYRIALDLLTG
jgi:arylformamidase